MSIPPRTQENRILEMLWPEDSCRLPKEFESITVTRGNVLYGVDQRIRYVYFPRTALISLVGASSEGQTIEVGMVGHEGFLGIPVLFGATSERYQAITQIDGTLWRLPSGELGLTHRERPDSMGLLLRYAHVRMTQLIQSAICNRFHTLTQRLCRWLLTARDSRGSNELALTKEFLAEMIGCRRPGVATMLSRLQKSNLIKSHRGGVSILREKGLEEAACECYQLTKREMDTFLKDCARRI